MIDHLPHMATTFLIWQVHARPPPRRLGVLERFHQRGHVQGAAAAARRRHRAPRYAAPRCTADERRRPTRDAAPTQPSSYGRWCSSAARLRWSSSRAFPTSRRSATTSRRTSTASRATASAELVCTASTTFRSYRTSTASSTSRPTACSASTSVEGRRPSSRRTPTPVGAVPSCTCVIVLVMS